MSDFFEGLAARSSGAATALRPRTTSAYETQAPDVVEIEEELTPSANAANTHTVNLAPERPAIADRAEPIVVRDVVLPQAETPEAPSRSVLDQRAEPPVARLQHRADEHTHDETSTQDVQELQATSPEREPRIESRAPSSSVNEIIERGPEALPPRRPQPALPPQQATRVRRHPLTIRQAPDDNHHQPVVDRSQSDPVVRITIGRVELRAVQPAQPAPRPAPAPVPSGPTLAEFLEQRERRQ